MKPPKLYQDLTAKQVDNFIKATEGIALADKEVVELKENDLYGDFVISNGYYFKRCYENTYQCLQTPTEKQETRKVNFIKAPTDSLNYK